MSAAKTSAASATGLGTVTDVMTKDVILIASDAGLGDAARTLERAGVSGAPVGDRSGVVGIVTLGDLLARLPQHPSLVATTGPFHRYDHILGELSTKTGVRVRDVMSTHVITVSPDDSIAHAASLMKTGGVNRLPVVDHEGRLRGVVSRDDVVAAVAELDP